MILIKWDTSGWFMRPSAYLSSIKGFPGGSVVKNLPGMQETRGSIPGSGRSRGEGNGSTLQYCCLGNSMDRGAWWATVHDIARVGHNSD